MKSLKILAFVFGLLVAAGCGTYQGGPNDDYDTNTGYGRVPSSYPGDAYNVPPDPLIPPQRVPVP